MEPDVENEHNKDTSLVVFDDGMLCKLRRCNIIPRSLSDFEVFVRRLSGDAISDVVIQEVWKQIYSDNSESASCLTPKVVSESQELTFYNSKSYNCSTDSDPKSFEFNLKMPKQIQESRLGIQISRKSEMIYDKSEVKASNSDKSFTDVASELTIRNQNIGLLSIKTPEQLKQPFADLASEPNKIRNQNFGLHSIEIPGQLKQPCVVTASELTIRNQNIGLHSIKLPKQLKKPCAGKKTDALWEKDQIKEECSSDCEVISTESWDNSECNETDSDESVKILDSTNSTVTSSKEKPCPIHGNIEITKSRSSQDWSSNRKEKQMYIDTNIVEDDHVSTSGESFSKEKHQKNKKGRREKYNTLRSDVKHLKSLLVNLLLSLKSSTVNDSRDGTGTTNKNNMTFKSGNKQKTRKGKESFCLYRKKTGNTTRVALTEKLKASAFVEVNMSRKTTKLQQKKQQTPNHTKNNSELCPEVVELNSDSSDLDNGKRRKFLWRETIADVLKSEPKKWMSVEKLKRTVIAKYYYSRGNVSQNTAVKFFRYLHSTAGVVVNGDMAICVNKPIIEVSSKSKKKRFVLKTHLTTKEYKAS